MTAYEILIGGWENISKFEFKRNKVINIICEDNQRFRVLLNNFATYNVASYLTGEVISVYVNGLKVKLFKYI